MPSPARIRFDAKRALDHLLDLLRIEGLSGREGKVAAAVRDKLLRAGCRPGWIRHDRAHHSIPHDYEIGNLIVRIPGTRRGPRLLFSGHLDTVPLCRGASPVRRGRRLVPRGKTALGGDNRTACAALVSLAEVLLRSGAPRPPITLLFTVGEESGLWGARTVSPQALGRPALGFNIDGGEPARLVIGATSAERFEVAVHGRSSHAGVRPEEGISAVLIAARAIAEVSERGFFGLVQKGRQRGTSNVGIVRGGEARSHDPGFLRQIVGAYAKAFDGAARSVTSASGRRGRAELKSARDYDAFRLNETAPPVRAAKAAAARLGLAPLCVISNGGLDANYLNHKGIETVTLGAGQHNPHTVDEYVDLDEFATGCRLLIELATASG